MSMIGKIVSSRKMNCTLILPCICLLAFTGSQCSRREDRAQRDASTVTVFTPSDERLLGPHNYDGGFGIFLSLMLGTAEGWEGRLAERWEHSEDYRSWTFYLRRNVCWHDGVPVTAHDVKFSLELQSHPDVLYSDSYLWLHMESFTVLDEFTFTITFTQPKDALDEDFFIYPKHLLEDLDPKEFYSWDFWTHPIGNGPFRYVRHVPKIMMELEANPDFYKGKPKIERVVYKLGGGNRLTELLSGNVDIVHGLGGIDIPTLAADGRFRVYHTANPNPIMIYWNHRHPLFRDRRVRRALTLAINRRELFQLINFSENIPIIDAPYSWTQWARKELLEPLPYSPERAKQLLEEAGWRDQDGDGIRERDGEEARFTALSSFSVAPTYVQAQLLRIGIQMELRMMTRDALLPRLLSGEFEAVFGLFWAANPQAPSLYSPDSPIGYSNPQIVKLLQTAGSIIDDPEAVDQIFRELQQIFYEEVPMTFLYPWVLAKVAHRRIRWPDDNSGGLENAWLEEEK